MGRPDWGLLVLDKPAGPSSHAAARRAQRALGAARAGHAGTLDPAASGVLLVGLGKATRLLEYLTGHDKAYRARVRLGRVTDTLDREGRLLEQQPVPPLDDERIEAALAGLRGPQLQVPPAFSAVKQGGERLYRRARRGEDVRPDPRPVTVHRLDLVERDGPDLVLDVVCSKGTYVRSVARDLGEALGTGATLWELVRTRSGPFGLEDAVSLAEVEDRGPDAWDRVLPASRMVDGLPRVSVDDRELALLADGRPVERDAPAGGEAAAAFGPDGDLVAVVRPDGPLLRPAKVFVRC